MQLLDLDVKLKAILVVSALSKVEELNHVSTVVERLSEV